VVARHLQEAGLTVLARAATYLDVNSERGSVRNSVASPDSPDASDAEVTVHARTRHGDIIIQRAAR
jgi:hypothetical protein